MLACAAAGPLSSASSGLAKPEVLVVCNRLGVLSEGRQMSEASEEMLERFAAVVAALVGEEDVGVGQKGKKGFGSSALQVNGKIFAMISSSGSFVVKLPKQRVEELEVSGVGTKFDPGHGRLMKEWLALNRNSHEECLPLAREALRFVRGKS